MATVFLRLGFLKTVIADRSLNARPSTSQWTNDQQLKIREVHCRSSCDIGSFYFVMNDNNTPKFLLSTAFFLQSISLLIEHLSPRRIGMSCLSSSENCLGSAVRFLSYVSLSLDRRGQAATPNSSCLRTVRFYFFGRLYGNHKGRWEWSAPLTSTRLFCLMDLLLAQAQ